MFVDALRERGVTVFDFGTLLGETLALAEARRWLLDRRANAAAVGEDLVGELRGWLDEMPAVELGRYLIGGIARAELPFTPTGLVGRTMDPQDFVLPPCLNPDVHPRQLMLDPRRRHHQSMVCRRDGQRRPTRSRLPLPRISRR